MWSSDDPPFIGQYRFPISSYSTYSRLLGLRDPAPRYRSTTTGIITALLRRLHLRLRLFLSYIPWTCLSVVTASSLRSIAPILSSLIPLLTPSTHFPLPHMTSFDRLSLFVVVSMETPNSRLHLPLLYSILIYNVVM